MAFKLGNHNIDEILFGAMFNSDEELLYTLDQLSSASIEISAESTDITDKNGNVVRTLYTSKSGTFNATNAWLHPQVMNAASGSDIEVASSTNKIKMPVYVTVAAGADMPADLANAVDGSVRVIGYYGNGANDVALSAADSKTFVQASKAPTGDAEAYFVSYEKEFESGIVLSNDATKFPKKTVFRLYCSYVDPCSDDLKTCIVEIPSFMADPNMTISLDRETQEMDFNGTLQMNFCSATEKILYKIYYPDAATVTGAVTEPGLGD